jgi:hypothetical protein
MSKLRLNDATPEDWNRLQREAPAIEAQRSGLEHWEKHKDCSKSLLDDAVNNPCHYNSGSIEAIDAIEASMSREAFIGYCKGNTLKYIWRMTYKGKAVQDCKKAQWYLAKMIEVLEKND